MSQRRTIPPPPGCRRYAVEPAAGITRTPHVTIGDDEGTGPDVTIPPATHRRRLENLLTLIRNEERVMFLMGGGSSPFSGQAALVGFALKKAGDTVADRIHEDRVAAFLDTET